ncbi:MAG: hypothetical protein WBN40_08095 [Pseudomonadales bacterium]
MHSGKVLAGCDDQVFYLRFTGDVRLSWCLILESYCSYVLEHEDVTSMVIDLSAAVNLDSTTLGILAKIGQAARKRFDAKADIYLQDEGIQRLLLSMGFTQLFALHLAPPPRTPSLPVLPLGDSEEADIQDSVIDAHRALMEMNKQNTRKFQSLVETLERAREGEPPSSSKK